MIARLFFQLAPLLLVTSAILVCGYLFLSLKREMYSVSRRLKERDREFETWKHSVMQELASIGASTREAEERAGVLVAPSPPKSGLNLNKRSQALKMSRLGGTPEKISAALGVPRREVELLLKVQKIVLQNTANSTT